MSNFWTPVSLGSTDLRVVPLGLAASYGVSGKDAERAFERGLNLFYWGAKYAPGLPRSIDFGKALRRIAAQHREKIVTIIQSYQRSPASMVRSLEKGIRGLGLEYTDIVLLGWWNLRPPEPLLDAAAEMVGRGVARHIMISCHHRPSFPVLARDPRVNLLMVRYNAAHPGAERDVFPSLPERRPGIIAYTSTSWGQLMNPKLMPAGERVSTATDCYRFVLTNPFIDACYTGAKNGKELDGALQALDLGPMDADELAWMRRVGASVWEKTRARRAGSNVIERVMNLASGFGFRSSAEAARHMQHG